MKNLSSPEISKDLIAILKRGNNISAEVADLQKFQIEEVRQYSDTWLLILDSRLRALNTRNGIMERRSGRRSRNDWETRKIEKDMELFNTLRSKMAGLS
jgi:hypothetical protein